VRRELLSHHWPGNAVNCEKVIERAVILETGRESRPAICPIFILETRLRKGDVPMVTAGQSLDEIMATLSGI